MARLISRMHDLLIELRRRNVTRVALSYLVVAWVLVQVVDVVFPALSLPPWTVTLVVVLAILGAPVAMVLAWSFDLSAEGVRRESPIRPNDVVRETGSEESHGAYGAAEEASTGGANCESTPLPATPLVGRAEELARIDAHLRGPDTRLVTILGSGGVGKTRLALEAARRNADAFVHGVRFVPLSEVEPDEPLARVLVRSLDIPASEHADPATPLLAFLRQKSLLLVLDNFEQLTSQATVLAGLLAGSPGLKVLCTSRERLNLYGETLVPIEGLPYDTRGDPEAATDAVELFTQAARRIYPALSPSAPELEAIGQICRSVQGIPLALELAAAWVGVLSCREIATEIERNHDFLFGSARDVPERHRSLRAVFEGSWRQLSPAERQVFARLSVFRGGFSRAAAEQVAGASLVELSALSDKSLVERRPSGRFEILQILRQYATERLAQDPTEAQLAAEAHGRYFADLLHDAHARLHPAVDQKVIEEIGGEIDNIREAWRWMVRERREAEIARSLEALFLFYNTRGWAREGSEAFAAAATRLREREQGAGPAVLPSRLTVREGALLIQLGQYDRAEALLEEALAVFRIAGESGDEALALDRLGTIATHRGRYDDARAHLERALQIFQRLGDQRGVAGALMSLGILDFTVGDYRLARQRLQESLALGRRIGDARRVALALINLGGVAFIERAYAEANSLLEESLAIDRSLGNHLSIANALQNLGCVAFGAGDFRAAERYLREGIAMSQEMGFRRLEAYCTNELASVFLAEERLDEAWQLYHDALRTAADMGMVPAVLQFLLGIARVLHQRGEATQALEILALVLRHPMSERSTQDQAREAWRSLVAESPPGGPAPDAARDLETTLRQLLDTELAIPAPGSH